MREFKGKRRVLFNQPENLHFTDLHRLHKIMQTKIINPGVRDVISLDLVKYAIAVLLKLTFNAQSFDFFLFSLFVCFCLYDIKKPNKSGVLIQSHPDFFFNLFYF